MGPDATIFVFWMLNFKPAFSLSLFTFIKKLFSSLCFLIHNVIHNVLPICNSRRRISPETNPAGTSILDLQLPELWRSPQTSVNLCYYGSWASECFSTSCLTFQAHFDFSLPQPCLWRSWIPLSGQWYLVADLPVSGSTLLAGLLTQDLSRQNLDRWMLLSEEDHTRLNLLESSFLLSSTRCWFLRPLVPLISH